MPDVVALVFIRNGRPGANERHVPAQNIEKLRKLIEAGFANETANRGDTGIVGDLEDLHAPWGILLFGFAGNKILDVLLVSGGVVVHVHRTKLQKREGLAELSNTFLPEQNRTF